MGQRRYRLGPRDKAPSNDSRKVTLDNKIKILLCIREEVLRLTGWRKIL